MYDVEHILCVMCVERRRVTEREGEESEREEWAHGIVEWREREIAEFVIVAIVAVTYAMHDN